MSDKWNEKYLQQYSRTVDNIHTESLMFNDGAEKWRYTDIDKTR